MKRSTGIDIIKACAVLFVVSVHFFLNTGYYSQNLTPGENLFFQTFLRWFFLISVPLFMITTGYLQGKKQVSWSYYKGLLPVLGVYLLYSLIAISVRSKYFNEHQEVVKWFYEIISFTANGYSWYVNMFIGLFLLVPFLNLIFNNLKNKRESILLIGVLLILTGLPSFFNSMPIEMNGSKFLFFPDWWVGLYPLTYYFIGCYIKKFQPKVKKLLTVFFLVVCVMIKAVLTHYFSAGQPFGYFIGEYSSIIVILTATLFFLIAYDIDIRNTHIAKSFRHISSLTLDIYLASYFVDRIVYRYVMSNVFETNYQIIYYFVPIVGTVFVCSLIIASIRKLITDALISGLSRSMKTR